MFVRTPVAAVLAAAVSLSGLAAAPAAAEVDARPRLEARAVLPADTIGEGPVSGAAIGGALVLAADLASRSIPLDRSIPVGVLTTLAGTPVFLAVLVSMRRRLTS